MAITAYTGPPGAGKSYALVEQIIVPGVQAGRRVLTNIDGVDPEAVYRYCAERSPDPSSLGRVILFDGRKSVEPGFWPTETIPDTDTFVKGGDLIVFDEWRLYWPRRGKMPSPDLEPFLRWHRHLSDGRGVSCDVAIASQLIQDISQDFRGLIERSYKFKKLKAVGLDKAFAWDVYEGHLQSKGAAYKTGNGTYKNEIYALYSSYSGGKSATELVTDKRTSIMGRGVYVAVAVGVIACGFAAWNAYNFFTGAEVVPPAAAAPSAGQPVVGTPGPAGTVAAVPSSIWRIAGRFEADGGMRVMLLSTEGAARMIDPGPCRFDDDRRPLECTVDGQRVLAEDRFAVGAGDVPMFPGMGL